VLEFDRKFREGQNWGGRLGRAVSYLFSDDARYEDDFARSARAGRQFLVIHAPHDETAELARPILNAHKARLARYFRQGSVEDMVYPRPD
jgi:hypothetical protein